ncbi:hypothetical protein BDB01DRAFT_857246 [Pilobolus umbonatus]|nr:hypothetical protein BDB01DRAFT_857246 [Pilobolus umbonatus]
MNRQLFREYMKDIISSGDVSVFFEFVEDLRNGLNHSSVGVIIEENEVTLQYGEEEEVLFRKEEVGIVVEGTDSRKRGRSGEESPASDRVLKRMKKAEALLKKLDKAKDLEGEKLDWRSCDLYPAVGLSTHVGLPTDLKSLISQALAYLKASKNYDMNYYILCLRSFVLFKSQNLSKVSFANDFSEIKKNSSSTISALF